jgi:hypothetical protein
VVNDELPCARFSWLLHNFGVGNNDSDDNDDFDDGDDFDNDDDDDDDVEKYPTHL